MGRFKLSQIKIVVIKRGLVDSPLFLCYNGYIMRTMNPKIKSKLLKLRAKNGGMDIFYSYTNWTMNIIDGEEYYPVVKFMPSHDETQVIHYMKKSNMEIVK